MSEFLNKILNRAGITREVFAEEKEPPSFASFVIIPFFGDDYSQFIFATLLLNRFKENSIYNENLNAITIFPYSNVYKKVKFYKIILNFSFKSINFKKKKVLPFFLAMELLVNQKCIVTLSSKNVLA